MKALYPIPVTATTPSCRIVAPGVDRDSVAGTPDPTSIAGKAQPRAICRLQGFNHEAVDLFIMGFDNDAALNAGVGPATLFCRQILANYIFDIDFGPGGIVPVKGVVLCISTDGSVYTPPASTLVDLFVFGDKFTL